MPWTVVIYWRKGRKCKQIRILDVSIEIPSILFVPFCSLEFPLLRLIGPIMTGHDFPPAVDSTHRNWASSNLSVVYHRWTARCVTRHMKRWMIWEQKIHSVFFVNIGWCVKLCIYIISTCKYTYTYYTLHHNQYVNIFLLKCAWQFSNLFSCVAGKSWWVQPRNSNLERQRFESAMHPRWTLSGGCRLPPSSWVCWYVPMLCSPEHKMKYWQWLKYASKHLLKNLSQVAENVGNSQSPRG